MSPPKLRKAKLPAAVLAKRRAATVDLPRICLTMIVKDEAHCIVESLASVVRYIDTWCIVDTGSSDDTPQVIRDFFAKHNMDGVLHSRPWNTDTQGAFDFAFNRSLALELARPLAQYSWMMDADDYMSGDFFLPLVMTADAYRLKIRIDSITYPRPHIFSNRRRWRYRCIRHEYATCDDDRATLTLITGDYYLCARTVGARSADDKKYTKDAAAVREWLEHVPANDVDLVPRMTFYLAQSYSDAGMHAEALDAYLRRTKMTGYIEEVYMAWYRIGWLYLDHLRHEYPDTHVDMALDAWTRAERTVRTRNEASFFRAQKLFELRRYDEAYAICTSDRRTVRHSDDTLMAIKDIYEYRFDMLYCECALKTNRVDVACDNAQRLLDNDELVAKMTPYAQKRLRAILWHRRRQ